MSRFFDGAEVELPCTAHCDWRLPIANLMWPGNRAAHRSRCVLRSSHDRGAFLRRFPMSISSVVPNSAGQSAMYFSNMLAVSTRAGARRFSRPKACPQYLIDQIAATSKHSCCRLMLMSLRPEGRTFLESVCIANADTGEVQTVPATRPLYLHWRDAAVPIGWQTVVVRDPQGLSPGRTCTAAQWEMSQRDGTLEARPLLTRKPVFLASSSQVMLRQGSCETGGVREGLAKAPLQCKFVHQYLSGGEMML